MLVGACYYPEHWQEDRWKVDAKLMKEAGLNTVRIGEFAWNRLERHEGEFTFDWLDRCFDILMEEGISVIIGTPTASPPKWVVDQHPGIYKRDMYGHARGFGTRMHYCFNNEDYPRYVKAIVGAMVEHYKNHPAVIGWQIDNEFGCADTTWCYCDDCRDGFRLWLENKYSDIEALNEAWGTVVWNNMYNSFEEIELPKLTTYQLHNPSFQLDFRRFSSDAVVKFQRIQVDLIRSKAPHQPITHNMMGIFGEIDYYKLAEDLDIAGLDLYPGFPDAGDAEVNPYSPALQHDMTRGIKGGSNYWILEFQSGTPGGSEMFLTPKPGDLRRWSYQAVGHGADALTYFRWRTAAVGAEEFWHGILQHSGRPGRKYDEVKRVGQELRKLAPILEGTTIRNEIAIVRCYEHEWVFDIQPQSPGYSYKKGLKHYHRSFFERGNGVDMISPETDFSAYKLVVFPNFAMIDEKLAAKVQQYVEQGGTAVFDFRAGSKLTDNRMRMEVLPGPLKELLGIEIDDYGIIPAGSKLRLVFEEEASTAAAGSDEGYGAHVWYDVIHHATAETVARFDEDYVAGAPAVTCNRLGAGRAYYLAAELDRAALSRLMDRICQESGIESEWIIESPGVEVCVREKQGVKLYFVINHSGSTVAVQPPKGLYDQLNEQPLAAKVTLEANEVLVAVRNVGKELA